jgi:glycosyltransferase involved in cell wall biosynthesis
MESYTGNVSILMPVKNGIKYLSKSRLDIEKNLGPNDEVLIIDDNSDDDMRGANDKLDFLYPPAELHPTQIEKLQYQIKQKPEFIGEIKIIPSVVGNSFFDNNTTTSHPQLYNFVKQNLPRIFDAIKRDDPENFEDYWEDEIEEGDESFRDIKNYEVKNENYWEYVDEEDEYPHGQDISIDFKDTDCRGFYISNMSPEQHNEITSGFGGHDLPGFPGLYYEYIYC